MRDYLYLAPLQSFTDRHFRNAFQQCFGDVDRFYAPYLKLNNDGSIKSNTKLDILPENNPYETVVPQIMACSAHDFLHMVDYISSLGYTEVNWNLGCPYPMVANRDLGSGMLSKPDTLFRVLEEVCMKTNLKIGIKMRMGYETTQDILHILPRLNDFPLSEVIVHARYGKQLYNGTCDHDRFEECIPLCSHQLVYNGDICSVNDYRNLKARFPQISHWMIGRGAIANPFIFEMIQDNTDQFPEDHEEVFQNFLVLLVNNHFNEIRNEGIVLKRMLHYWEYFASSFENGNAIYRSIKRCKSIYQYEGIIDSYFR
jgi:tRNA-dihydrouridine synthase B